MADTVTTGQPEPKTIQLPPEFPVTWKDPQDQLCFWQRDQLHFPEPITPITFAVALHTGINHAMNLYELPIGYRGERINTYFYLSIVPVVALEKMEAQGKRGMENIENAMARLDEIWSGEALPEVKRHLAHWEAFDLYHATLPELLSHLNDTVTMMKRMYEVHHTLTFPWLVAQSMFEDLYRELFPGAESLDAYKLLQGFPNKALEANQALWDLSRKASASPAVCSVLERSVSRDVIVNLKESDEGRLFVTELQARSISSVPCLQFPTWCSRTAQSTRIMVNTGDSASPRSPYARPSSHLPSQRQTARFMSLANSI